MPTIFYVASRCSGAFISPSSGSWHQNSFKTFTSL